jgi:hypothetical protein
MATTNASEKPAAKERKRVSLEEMLSWPEGTKIKNVRLVPKEESEQRTNTPPGANPRRTPPRILALETRQGRDTANPGKVRRLFAAGVQEAKTALEVPMNSETNNSNATKVHQVGKLAEPSTKESSHDEMADRLGRAMLDSIKKKPRDVGIRSRSPASTAPS